MQNAQKDCLQECSQNRPSHRRAIIATLAGNALESFDFAIYAFFSITIGQLFFPGHSPSTALLLSVAIYAVGFTMRPVGALVFGIYADRFGRRGALTITLSLMGLGTLLIACAPTYAQIGYFAPCLLILGRLLQGFSQGGEVGTCMTALIEIDRRYGRGFRSSLEMSSAALAGIGAAATVLILTHTVPMQTILDWAWRIPFFVGALAAPAGILLRFQLTDDRPKEPPPAAREVAKVALSHWKTILLCVLMMQGGSTGYVMAGYYLPIHAMHWLGLDLKTVHWIGIASSTTLLLCCPLFGWWSDLVKRRTPFLFGGRFTAAVLIVPAYWLINHYPSLPLIMAMAALIKFFLGAASSITPAFLAETFPREIRATALSICMAIVTTCFAGTAQIVAVGLISWSGNLLAPAIYASISLLLSAYAALRLKDTGRDAIS